MIWIFITLLTVANAFQPANHTALKEAVDACLQISPVGDCCADANGNVSIMCEGTDLPNWDTSYVTDMNHMFFGATEFNQELYWDTSRVTNMRNMFYEAREFNKPVNFDTSSVTDMYGIFAYADVFNQPLNWDTSNVNLMQYVFYEAKKFNKPLNWDTSKVTTTKGMFMYSHDFNQPLNWDTSSVTDMSNMFLSASSFNQLLVWDLGSLTFISNMFYEAHRQYHPIQYNYSASVIKSDIDTEMNRLLWYTKPDAKTCLLSGQGTLPGQVNSVLCSGDRVPNSNNTDCSEHLCAHNNPSCCVPCDSTEKSDCVSRNGCYWDVEENTCGWGCQKQWSNANHRLCSSTSLAWGSCTNLSKAFISKQCCSGC